ncbi:MAG: hypothetical protein ACOZHQ_03540 [Thermodesulfobacteriota bacterium]
MSLPKDYKDQLLKRLHEKKVGPICERCSQNDWVVIENGISLIISDFGNAFSVPPPQIPCGAIICKNCGNVRLHALGALGIFPSQGDSDGK